MNKGEKYFIRIDEKAVKETPPRAVFDEHVAYLLEIAGETAFYGGGFTDNPGGMILFKAKTRERAGEICDNDPIIKSGFYRYTLREWEILISSEQ
jgi:uncharacterized protein YciI